VVGRVDSIRFALSMKALQINLETRYGRRPYADSMTLSRGEGSMPIQAGQP
jgi:hypothetical protein